MRRLSLLFVLFLAVVSCGQDENKLAARFLERAAECMSGGSYQEAKLLIDSVRIVYPKAFEARKEGIRLLQKVEIAEAERTVAFQDSVLSALRARLDEVKDRFVFEKDEKYQDIGNYMVSSQSVEKNIGRNYIRGQVDEKGRMILVSSFSGTSYIHHRSLRLSSGDNFVETPVSDDFYEYSDLGVCYEKCNFTNGKDGGAAAFISLHKGEPIKVEIRGTRNVSADMRPADINAISELYSFSLLLSSIDEAASLRDEALRKIKFVNENIAKADSIQLQNAALR